MIVTRQHKNVDACVMGQCVIESNCVHCAKQVIQFNPILILLVVVQKKKKLSKIYKQKEKYFILIRHGGKRNRDTAKFLLPCLPAQSLLQHFWFMSFKCINPRKKTANNSTYHVSKPCALPSTAVQQMIISKTSVNILAFH